MKRSASIALVLILALAGDVLAQEPEPYPPPGRLIDVGEHRPEADADPDRVAEAILDALERTRSAR